MEGIVTWIRNIACLYLVLSLILNILPDVEEKKYIQFFGSILVTICLLHPILEFGNVGERLEQNVISNVLEESFVEMMRQTNQKEIVGVSYVREACEMEMKRQVNQWMQVYGYEVISCEVEFWEEEVLELKDLHIKVRNRKEEVRSKTKQIEFLKNELINVYNIPEGNINISIQG